MASIHPKFLKTVLFLLLWAAAASSSEAAYRRIISLYPGHTDNIAALGGEPLLVGLSRNDDPNRLPQLPRFPLNSGAETLLALRPDLVLIRTLVEKQNPELKKVLERAGVTVCLIDPPSWDGFGDYLRRLAPLIGADPAEAAALWEKTRRDIHDESERRRAGRPAPKVFMEATAKELHTCAPNSWAARLIALAGGINAASAAEPGRRGSAVAPWGLERVLQLSETGLDVYLVQHGPMNSSDIDSVLGRPWFSALKGVRAAVVPERWLSRPSLSGLKDGGMALIQIFYGE